MADCIVAADFTALRPQFQTEPKGAAEHDCSFEHFSQHGTMIDYYYITPTPELKKLPEVEALAGGLDTVTFLEQRDGPWLVHLHGAEMDRKEGNVAELPMDRAEMDKMLADCGVTLPKG